MTPLKINELDADDLYNWIDNIGMQDLLKSLHAFLESKPVLNYPENATPDYPPHVLLNELRISFTGFMAVKSILDHKTSLGE